jgi:hypothetical protein
MGKHEETRKKWLEVVGEYRRAGKTQTTFAAGAGVGLAALRYWITKLGHEKRSAKTLVSGQLRLVPVVLTGRKATPLTEGHSGGARFLNPMGMDSDYVAALIVALKRARDGAQC